MMTRTDRGEVEASVHDTRVMPFVWRGVVGALAGAALVATIVPGCRGGCNLVGCSNGATITGHVAVDKQALLGAVVTLCVEAKCTTATLAGAEDAGHGEVDAGTVPTVGRLSGPDLYGDVQIEQIARGWTLVRARPALAEVHQGDRYTMRIVAADGTTLLDFERGVRYESFYPNGEQCDDGCKVAGVNAWATSPSGLTCAGQARASETTLTMKCAPFGDALTVRVCRNDECSEASWKAGGGPSAGGFVTDRGPLTFQYTQSGDTMTVSIEGEPAVLADGDHYTVTATSGDGQVVASTDQIATYEVTYPSGPGCDAYPSRTFAHEDR